MTSDSTVNQLTVSQHGSDQHAPLLRNRWCRDLPADCISLNEEALTRLATGTDSLL